MKSLLEYITEDIPKRNKDIHKEDIPKIDEDTNKEDMAKIDEDTNKEDMAKIDEDIHKKDIINNETLLRFDGRHPLCGTGVTSLMLVTSIPHA